MMQWLVSFLVLFTLSDVPNVEQCVRMFTEFGVYVDNKGRRSRPADMKWSCLPLSLGRIYTVLSLSVDVHNFLFSFY